MSLLGILLVECPLLIIVSCAIVGVYGYLILTRCETYEVLVEGDSCAVVANGILLVTIHGAGGPTLDNTCVLIALGGVKVVVDDE